MGLDGKVVVVTGSTRGIGRAIAEEAGRAGAIVVISSRTADAVAETVRELSAAGAAVSGFSANVGHWEEIDALKAHALETHGRIDVWFSNAGVSSGYQPLDEEDNQALHDLVTINVLGHIYGAKAVIPYFREHGGYLMNMCGRGWKGSATPYTAAYAASKAAIASLTRSLAEENRDCANVSINAFTPGMVDTDFYADNMVVSPRLASTAGNVRLALDAFGTPIDEVARRAVSLVCRVARPQHGKNLRDALAGQDRARRRQDGVVGHDGEDEAGMSPWPT